MIKKAPLMKAVALCLCICILFFDLKSHASTAPAPNISQPIKPLSIPLPVIPEELGTIESISQASKGKTLYLIQDAHAQTQAQESIQKILNYLYETQSVETLFLEGGLAGPISPDLLRFFEDPQINQQMAQSLMKQGAIAGPDLFVLEKGTSIKVHGVESQKLYQTNLISYRKVYLQTPERDLFVESFKTKLLSRASNILNPDLGRFVREWLAFQDSKRQMLSHLNELFRSAQKHLKLDLKNAQNQWRYPQLVRFAKLQEVESRIKNEGSGEPFEREKNRLLAWIKAQEMGPDMYLKFHQSLSPDIKQVPKDLRKTLEAFDHQAVSKGFDWEAFPNANNLFARHILTQELESKKLFEEIAALTEALMQKLTQNQEEEQFLELFRETLLLKKLLHLELTRPEYQEVLSKGNAMSPSALMTRLGLATSQEDADKVFRHAHTFYQVAAERESTMIQTVLNVLASSSQNKAALVVGGFHTSGMLQELQENGISVVSILPKFELLESSENYIHQMMLGKVDTAQSTVISSNPARISVPTMEVALSSQDAGFHRNQLKQELEKWLIQTDSARSIAFILQSLNRSARTEARIESPFKQKLEGFSLDRMKSLMVEAEEVFEEGDYEKYGKDGFEGIRKGINEKKRKIVFKDLEDIPSRRLEGITDYQAKDGNAISEIAKNASDWSVNKKGKRNQPASQHGQGAFQIYGELGDPVSLDEGDWAIVESKKEGHRGFRAYLWNAGGGNYQIHYEFVDDVDQGTNIFVYKKLGPEAQLKRVQLLRNNFKAHSSSNMILNEDEQLNHPEEYEGGAEIDPDAPDVMITVNDQGFGAKDTGVGMSFQDFLLYFLLAHKRKNGKLEGTIPRSPEDTEILSKSKKSRFTKAEMWIHGHRVTQYDSQAQDNERLNVAEELLIMFPRGTTAPNSWSSVNMDEIAVEGLKKVIREVTEPKEDPEEQKKAFAKINALALLIRETLANDLARAPLWDTLKKRVSALVEAIQSDPENTLILVPNQVHVSEAPFGWSLFDAERFTPLDSELYDELFDLELETLTSSGLLTPLEEEEQAAIDEGVPGLQEKDVSIYLSNWSLPKTTGETAVWVTIEGRRVIILDKETFSTQMAKSPSWTQDLLKDFDEQISEAPKPIYRPKNKPAAFVAQEPSVPPNLLQKAIAAIQRFWKPLQVPFFIVLAILAVLALLFLGYTMVLQSDHDNLTAYNATLEAKMTELETLHDDLYKRSKWKFFAGDNRTWAPKSQEDREYVLNQAKKIKELQESIKELLEDKSMLEGVAETDEAFKDFQEMKQKYGKRKMTVSYVYTGDSIGLISKHSKERITNINLPSSEKESSLMNAIQWILKLFLIFMIFVFVWNLILNLTNKRNETGDSAPMAQMVTSWVKKTTLIISLFALVYSKYGIVILLLISLRVRGTRSGYPSNFDKGSKTDGERGEKGHPRSREGFFKYGNIKNPQTGKGGYGFGRYIPLVATYYNQLDEETQEWQELKGVHKQVREGAKPISDEPTVIETWGSVSEGSTMNLYNYMNGIIRDLEVEVGSFDEKGNFILDPSATAQYQYGRASEEIDFDEAAVVRIRYKVDLYEMHDIVFLQDKGTHYEPIIGNRMSAEQKAEMASEWPGRPDMSGMSPEEKRQASLDYIADHSYYDLMQDTALSRPDDQTSWIQAFGRTIQKKGKCNVTCSGVSDEHALLLAAEDVESVKVGMVIPDREGLFNSNVILTRKRDGHAANLVKTQKEINGELITFWGADDPTKVLSPGIIPFIFSLHLWLGEIIKFVKTKFFAPKKKDNQTWSEKTGLIELFFLYPTIFYRLSLAALILSPFLGLLVGTNKASMLFEIILWVLAITALAMINKAFFLLDASKEERLYRAILYHLGLLYPVWLFIWIREYYQLQIIKKRIKEVLLILGYSDELAASHSERLIGSYKRNFHYINMKRALSLSEGKSFKPVFLLQKNFLRQVEKWRNWYHLTISISHSSKIADILGTFLMIHSSHNETHQLYSGTRFFPKIDPSREWSPVLHIDGFAFESPDLTQKTELLLEWGVRTNRLDEVHQILNYCFNKIPTITDLKNYQQIQGRLLDLALYDISTATNLANLLSQDNVVLARATEDRPLPLSYQVSASSDYALNTLSFETKSGFKFYAQAFLNPSREVKSWLFEAKEEVSGKKQKINAKGIGMNDSFSYTRLNQVGEIQISTQSDETLTYTFSQDVSLESYSAPPSTLLKTYESEPSAATRNLIQIREAGWIEWLVTGGELPEESLSSVEGLTPTQNLFEGELGEQHPKEEGLNLGWLTDAALKDENQEAERSAKGEPEPGDGNENIDLSRVQRQVLDVSASRDRPKEEAEMLGSISSQLRNPLVAIKELDANSYDAIQGRVEALEDLGEPIPPELRQIRHRSFLTRGREGQLQHVIGVYDNVGMDRKTFAWKALPPGMSTKSVRAQAQTILDKNISTQEKVEEIIKSLIEPKYQKDENLRENLTAIVESNQSSKAKAIEISRTFKKQIRADLSIGFFGIGSSTVYSVGDEVYYRTGLNGEVIEVHVRVDRNDPDDRNKITGIVILDWQEYEGDYQGTSTEIARDIDSVRQAGFEDRDLKYKTAEFVGALDPNDVEIVQVNEKGEPLPGVTIHDTIYALATRGQVTVGESALGIVRNSVGGILITSDRKEELYRFVPPWVRRWMDEKAIGLYFQKGVRVLQSREDFLEAELLQDDVGVGTLQALANAYRKRHVALPGTPHYEDIIQDSASLAHLPLQTPEVIEHAQQLNNGNPLPPEIWSQYTRDQDRYVALLFHIKDESGKTLYEEIPSESEPAELEGEAAPTQTEEPLYQKGADSALYASFNAFLGNIHKALVTQLGRKEASTIFPIQRGMKLQLSKGDFELLEAFVNRGESPTEPIDLFRNIFTRVAGPRSTKLGIFLNALLQASDEQSFRTSSDDVKEELERLRQEVETSPRDIIFVAEFREAQSEVRRSELRTIPLYGPAVQARVSEYAAKKVVSLDVREGQRQIIATILWPKRSFSGVQSQRVESLQQSVWNSTQSLSAISVVPSDLGQRTNAKEMETYVKGILPFLRQQGKSHQLVIVVTGTGLRSFKTRFSKTMDQLYGARGRAESRKAFSQIRFLDERKFEWIGDSLIDRNANVVLIAPKGFALDTRKFNIALHLIVDRVADQSILPPEKSRTLLGSFVSVAIEALLEQPEDRLYIVPGPDNAWYLRDIEAISSVGVFVEALLDVGRLASSSA